MHVVTHTACGGDVVCSLLKLWGAHFPVVNSNLYVIGISDVATNARVCSMRQRARTALYLQNYTCISHTCGVSITSALAFIPNTYAHLRVVSVFMCAWYFTICGSSVHRALTGSILYNVALAYHFVPASFGSEQVGAAFVVVIVVGFVTGMHDVLISYT